MVSLNVVTTSIVLPICAGLIFISVLHHKEEYHRKVLVRGVKNRIEDENKTTRIESVPRLITAF